MLLKRIKIENIRSYVSETIEFPTGSVLLAGDIGSGKSTILLAAEFALFGIMKGDISGFHLLRHGAKEGNVELTLEINGKEIIIKRGLKRTSNGIQQESGYLIIDGRKTDLVAKELKARILNLLGYSESLLNKSKSLIYRYTVYTPQEDMKRIILSTPDERLNTLRSVFGIDKYKTIRENASNYSRELKRKISYVEGQVQDLDEIKTRLMEKTKLKDELIKNIQKIEPDLKKAKDNVKNMSELLSRKEIEIDRIRQVKNNLKIIESRIESAKRDIKSYDEKILLENERTKQLALEIGGSRKVNEEKLGIKIAGLKNEILKERNKIIETIRLMGQSEYKKNESLKISQKMASLTKCPTCMQEVDEIHKCKIIGENQEKVAETEKTLSTLLKEKDALEKKILQVEKSLEEYEGIQRKDSLVRLKIKLLDEKKSEILKLEKSLDAQKIIHEKLNEEKAKSEAELKGTKETEASFIILRQELIKLQKAATDEEIKFARISEQKNSVDEIIEGVKRQIEVKEELKKNISKMRDLYNWLTDFFENLILSMEKHVFSNIYYEFNELVSKWFSVLIGDETITLRLNSEFTPILEQNGYETEIENLSGGEKTAVALAYRLALNKVINDMVFGINTKDIIILDEPTDGFSSEQLDRVKEVIEELALLQVIIVSHEQKVEGFVDSIIRIEKNSHESRVCL
jgi:DNA repair protein SbcC/Rad50